MVANQKVFLRGLAKFRTFKVPTEVYSLALCTINKIMEEKDFEPKVEFIPPPDYVVKSDGNKDLTTSVRTYSVTVPEDEANDFVVEVRASVLKDIRSTLDKHSKSSFPWQEILLAITAILLGGFFSGIFSSLKIETDLGKLVFVAFPVISGITGTSYFFVRRDDNKSISDLSNDLLNKIPNPDNVKKK